MPRRGSYPRLKRFLLLAIGSLIGVLSAEAALRLAGIASPSPYQADLILGSRLKPNYSGWNTKEGRVYFRTNSSGFRDREHTESKADDTIRIAVLGDSYCEAQQVELAETFWATMARELNKCQPLEGKQIEVLNFGVSGYGTAQELLILRNYVWRYDPDIVLLAVLTGNDIRNNSQEMESDKLKPYFIIENNALKLDDSFTQQPFFTSKSILYKDRLIKSSHLLTLVYQTLHRHDNTSKTTVGSETGIDDFIYMKPKTLAQKNAWNLTERLIEQMHSEVENQGAKFVIVTLTNGIQVHPEPSVRAAFAKNVGAADLRYADRRVAALAERLACTSIGLVDDMASYAQGHDAFLHGFETTRPGTGHWNVLGHRIAGEAISARLCSDTNLWRTH